MNLTSSGKGCWFLCGRCRGRSRRSPWPWPPGRCSNASGHLSEVTNKGAGHLHVSPTLKLNISESFQQIFYHDSYCRHTPLTLPFTPQTPIKHSYCAAEEEEEFISVNQRRDEGFHSDKELLSPLTLNNCWVSTFLLHFSSRLKLLFLQQIVHHFQLNPFHFY